MSKGALRRAPLNPARVFRGGEVNSPPLIPRVRFAAPGGVNPAPLAAVAEGVQNAPHLTARGRDHAVEGFVGETPHARERVEAA